MEQILIPEKAKHSFINMFRPPYNKQLPASYEVKNHIDSFQKDVDFLFDTFLENYNYYRDEKMPFSQEKEFKAYNIPGPSQYKAFHELFSFFENEALELLKFKNFYYYDSTIKDAQLERGMLEFAEKLINYDFANQDKKVIISCASFYGKNTPLREKMLEVLESLHKKGIEIKLYMNCKKREITGHDKFLKLIKKTSHFGLKKRIPIHFIQAGNDYFFIEFPHTEEIRVRLNLFLDLKEIEYKKDIKKADVENFFYNIIQQTLN